MPTVSWDNHRWVRFRTTMGLLATQLECLRNANAKPPETGCGRACDLGSAPTGVLGI